MDKTAITLIHPQYPDITCTLGAPSEEAYAAAFDMVATNKSKNAGILSAGYNLLVACAQGVSRAEIPRLVDDWPALPERVFVEVDTLAGGLRFEGPGVEADEANAWKFDLVATVVGAKEIAELRAKLNENVNDIPRVRLVGLDADQDRLAELLAEHGANIEALAASGLDVESTATLVARFNRRGQLTAIRTRDHGVLIIRRPHFQEQLAFANNSTAKGNYAAAKMLALSVVEHPVNGAIGPRLTTSPSLTTSIAMAARGMVSEGMGAAVKK